MEWRDSSTGRTRRAVVLGAGCAAVAAALTGCTTYGADGQPAAGNGGGNAGGTDRGAEPGPGSSGGGNPGGGGGALAQVSDIPVGGGKVFADQKVVVTQPQQGQIKAFSAVCTHAGCTVESVSNGTINCPCHGSRYRIADGSVATGPAPRALSGVTVTVDGTAIRLA